MFGDCRMLKKSLRKSAMLWGATKVYSSRWSLRGVTLLLLDLDDDEDCEDGIDISVGLGELAIVIFLFGDVKKTL
jgi:hypothetical protein